VVCKGMIEGGVRGLAGNCTVTCFGRCEIKESPEFVQRGTTYTIEYPVTIPPSTEVLIKATANQVEYLCELHCKELAEQVWKYVVEGKLLVRSCAKDTCDLCTAGESAAPPTSRRPKGHTMRLIAHTGRFSHPRIQGSLADSFVRERDADWLAGGEGRRRDRPSMM
jgi:hypothetical protein